MRRHLITAAALVLLPAPALAQVGFDSLKTLWSNKQYATVIKPLVELRATAKAEQQLTIDYMIATSHCRLPDARQRAKGRLAFDAMLLYHYRSLTLAQQELLLAEREKCGAGQPANTSAVKFVSMNTRRGAARATYNYAGGKQYYDICGASPSGSRGEIAAEQAFEGTRSQPVWPRAQISGARDAALHLLDSFSLQGSVAARDGIVITTLGAHTPAQLDTILGALIRYRDFYAAEYALTLPDAVLQVYLAPSDGTMSKLANTLHGLPLDKRLIGYSALSDFTLVGIIPRTIYGTLMHELMHVLFRNHVSNAAPWVDEGLAALYEVSRVRGGRVIGIPNWRGQILYNSLRTGRLGRIPRLADLLELNWTNFEGRGNRGQQAINHAAARYFVLYLQDKGSLAAVVQAVSKQPVLSYKAAADTIDVQAASGTAQLQTIAAIMNITPARLQADFDAWLGTVVRQGWAPCN